MFAAELPLAQFDLEIFFAKYEFTAEYLLCSSDAETMKMKDLLNLADEECTSLWNNLSCGYTESEGLPLLREEISKWYCKGSNGSDNDVIKSNNIFCFAGAEEGIYTAMRGKCIDMYVCVCVCVCYDNTQYSQTSYILLLLLQLLRHSIINIIRSLYYNHTMLSIADECS